MVALEIYRRTTIGGCLSDTLDEMVSSGRLAPDLAYRVQLQFDESMSAALENLVTSRASFKVRYKSSFTVPREKYRLYDREPIYGSNSPYESILGHIHTYRYVDNVWTFILTDTTFWCDGISGKIPKLKIVAVNSSLGKPEVPPQQ